MFRFILKGIFRDRHRYLFPLIIVSSGIAIMVFMLAFMNGYVVSMIRYNANFETGHLKVVTRAYAEEINLKPVELALLEVEESLREWKQTYPQLEWASRIHFAALLDVPDSTGLTREQGDVAGFGIDIFGSPQEVERMKLSRSLVKGRLPVASGEILLSAQAFDRLQLNLGDPVTLIGSTVDGAMAMQNFRVAGAVAFGVAALDKGAVVADISDLRTMLNLEGGSGEILAWFQDGRYDHQAAKKLQADFNSRYSTGDEYSPVMLNLHEQNNMGYMLKLMNDSLSIMETVFILILGIVLWNSGLMNGIRRWGEFGIRLAVGESKGQVFRSLIWEAVVLGLVGSLIGVLLGGAVSLYFGYKGFDMAAYSQNSTIMADNIIYPALSLKACLTAFVPGILSTVLGAALAGLAVYRRQTAQLSKELET